MILTLLTTNTITSSTNTCNFTSKINSTYDEYMFVITDWHISGDGAGIRFQASTDSGSNYNVIHTTTAFDAEHTEAGGGAVLQYLTSSDYAQSTTGPHIALAVGNDADQSVAGIVHLFSPASTTYVKHFYSRTNTYNYDNLSADFFGAGYFNTTSAIDAIQFEPEGSSTIDNAVIQMYGVA